MEISIDTSTKYSSVGLSIDGTIISEISWCADRNHSMELVPAIRQIMERSGINFEHLEAVFVAKGPGGFSALRIGLSVAKSVAMAQSIPLIGIATLDIEATPFIGLNVSVCPLIDAGKNLIYTATYTNQKTKCSNPNYRVESYETLVASHKAKTLYCGEGVGSVAELFETTLGIDVLLINNPPPTRRPSILAKLGYDRLKKNDLDNVDTLKPIYIRGSQFEVPTQLTT